MKEISFRAFDKQLYFYTENQSVISQNLRNAHHSCFVKEQCVKGHVSEAMGWMGHCLSPVSFSEAMHGWVGHCISLESSMISKQVNSDSSGDWESEISMASGLGSWWQPSLPSVFLGWAFWPVFHTKPLQVGHPSSRNPKSYKVGSVKGLRALFSHFPICKKGYSTFPPECTSWCTNRTLLNNSTSGNCSYDQLTLSGPIPHSCHPGIRVEMWIQEAWTIQVCTYRNAMFSWTLTMKPY